MTRRISPSLVISVIALGKGSGAKSVELLAKGSGTKLKTFNKGANEGQTVTLTKNKQFKIVGNCDAADANAPSGFSPGSTGTWIGIKDLGQNNGFADTSDDDDSDFDIGDGVAFNYQDGGDEGEAILRNGHWVAVQGSIVFDSSDTTQFSTDCRFAGTADFH